MINKLKPKSEFSRNVLTLMTGTTIAQAIPIAISPILTRLYTPKDFGILALFVAITSIFGSIANGRYELAIMLPKKDEDAINILALGFIINIILFILLLFIVVFFHDNILKLLNNKEISPWLYLVPISVFLMGCFNLLNYFNNRKKFYKDLARANVYKSIGTAIVQLSLGFLKVGVAGLISGQIFSQIISNTKLFLNIKKLNIFEEIKKQKVLFLAKRYKKFPLIQLPANLLNLLSHHAVSILLAIYYSSTILGFYYLAQRILVLPTSFIGNSIKQVYFQEISLKKQQNLPLKKTFFNTLKKLFIIFLPFVIGVEFFIEDIVVLVFGKEWEYTVEILKVLIIFFWIRFIASNLFAPIFIVFEKQYIVLLNNIILFFSILFIFWFFNKLELIDILFYFSLILSIEYSIFLLFSYLIISRFELKLNG